MADLRISELTTLAGANLAAGDFVPLADISASESKKITVSDFIGNAVTLIADATIPNAKILFNSASIPGSALQNGAVGATQLADDSVSAAKLGDESSVDLVAVLPASGAFIGQIALDTDENKGYIWDGSQWISFKAAGSVNTVVGGTAGTINVSVATSGDQVTITASIDDTTAAAQFLAGPTGGAGAISARAIIGSDLPTATATTKGAVVVSGNGLTVDDLTSTLLIDNNITASTTNHVVTYNDKGLVTGGRALIGTDLPTATTTGKGGVIVGTGLAVDGTGLVNHSNAVVSGTATKVTYDNQGHITGALTLEASDIPDLPASKITSGAFATERIANDAVTGAKLANSSVTQIGGSVDTSGVVTFPAPEFTGQYFYDSLNGDLYLWDGNAWQPITITAGEIVFAGTYAAATNTVATVTTAGAAAGLTAGSALPAPAETNNRYYVIVGDSGTGTSPAPTVALQAPDMLLSDGTAWTHIDVSNTVVAQQASGVSITAISGITGSNVQAALEDLQDDKAETASPTFTGDVTLNGGDVVFDTGSFNTTLAAATGSAAQTITLPDATGTVLLAGNASIVNADISNSAAIAFSKLAALTSGNIIVGSAGNVPTSVAVTGDVTLSSAGVTAIAAGAVVNSDINAAAGISFSKLESLTSANILIGNSSNVPTATAVTGDVTISNTGVTSIAAGAIVNADISNSAAIADSKLATISTAGKVSGFAITSGTIGGSTAIDTTGAITTTGQATLKEIKETTFTLATTGTIALDPANGSIQRSVLTGAPTFTDALEAGQTVVLMLENGASYTVTWPTITWVTSAGNTPPTLTAKDTLVLWKVSTTLYGAYVGSYV